MTRHRITIITVVEYDAPEASYPTRCAETNLLVDIQNAKELPEDFLSMEGAKITVTGEIVNA